MDKVINELVITEEATSQNSLLNWRAYYDITKPKVVALLVLTALVGMSLSVPGSLPWQLLYLPC